MLAYVIDRPFNKIDPRIDILELRADLCSDFIPKNYPWILTIRREKDKGGFTLPEKNRFELFEKLLKFNPDYVDLELDVPISFVKEIKKKYPNLKLIRSYHNFKKTPANLEKYLFEMRHPLFDMYKIATFANSSLDALKMMHFVQNSNDRVSGICMGEKGSITRLGPLFENAMDYTSHNPFYGQISLEDLFGIYRYQTLRKDTPIYALIGNPIDHSVGPLFHNRFFEMINQQAVYVKLPLEEEELNDFFSVIKYFSFLGLSVTTPLKEKIQKFCKSFQGPINTLVWEKKKWIGKNTDGQGAMLALEKALDLKGKRALILGAGATAKAIAFQGIRKHLVLSVFNRDLNKANLAFPKKINVLTTLLSSEHFDLLINTTGGEIKEHLSFIPKIWLKSHVTVLDISYKIQKTTLIKIAEEKHCQTITGLTMFFYQALLQQQIWQKRIMKKSHIDSFKRIWKQDLRQYGYAL